MAKGGVSMVTVALVVLLGSILFMIQDVPINGKNILLGEGKYQMEGLVAPALSGQPLKLFSCKYLDMRILSNVFGRFIKIFTSST